jgi:DNA-binding beta-propeller fold protein YncE
MAVTPELRFEVLADWERLPADWTHLDCVGVGVDSADRVFLLTRDQPRTIVYGRDGEFLRSFGEDLFSPRTHGLTVGPADEIYVVDEGNHCVFKFSPDGDLLQTIGTPGTPSDTGYDGTLPSIKGGPPFNRPTNLAVAADGDLYISDGYGNCKVHRFTPAGELVESWGAPGTGEGEFNLPHGIAIDASGNVLVADRENDRVQIFDAAGRFLEIWDDVQRPTNIAIDPEGRIYVSELWWQPGDVSQTGGEIPDDRPGRVSIFDGERRLLARWGGSDRTAWGNFVAPHDIAVDSRGDIYVAEVTNTIGVRRGLVPEGTHTFQKFERRS